MVGEPAGGHPSPRNYSLPRFMETNLVQLQLSIHPDPRGPSKNFQKSLCCLFPSLPHKFQILQIPQSMAYSSSTQRNHCAPHGLLPLTTMGRVPAGEPVAGKLRPYFPSLRNHSPTLRIQCLKTAASSRLTSDIAVHGGNTSEWSVTPSKPQQGFPFSFVLSHFLRSNTVFCCTRFCCSTQLFAKIESHFLCPM